MELLVTLIALAVAGYVISIIPMPPVLKNIAYLVLGLFVLVVLLQLLGVAI